MVETTAEDYRFRLTVDASEAEKAAREFRQTIERELGRIDVGQMGGGLRQSTNGATSDLRKLEQELERLSSAKVDLGLDELRQKFEEIGREARKLEGELQGMFVTGGSTGDARYRAQLDDYYKNLARQRGDEEARRARNAGLVGNIGQIYSQHADDVRPVDEFSQRAYAEVQEKRRFSQEEQRRMLELEAQVYAAKLSETRTERALLERELQEAEQRTQGIELNEQTLPLFDQADQAYRRLASESARLAQAEEEAASNLAETKRRLAIDAAKRAPIGEGTGGAVSTRTVISVSAKSADEAERLARALDEVAQAKERVAAITRTDDASLSREIEAERQKARMRAESAQVAERLVQLERTSGEQARQAARQAAEAERGNTQQKRQGVVLAQQQLETARGLTVQQRNVGEALKVQSAEQRRVAAEANAVREAARAVTQEQRRQTEEAKAQTQALRVAEQERRQALEVERQKTIQIRQQTREMERQAAEARRTALAQSQSSGGGFGFGSRLRDFAIGGAVGYIAGQGLEGMLRGGYEMGKLGASNKQLTESFEELTEAVGLTGESLTNKLSAAVKETVPRVTLMTETNRLLLTSQNEGIKITEQQIETLAKFARLRSTQLTSEGRPLGTEEAFRRLVTGITKRETEVLDELGISTKGLAAQLGVPLQEINNSVEGLLTAILKTAEMELNLGGDKALTEAEKIQQAETRIQESMNRLRLAAVDPVVFTVDVVADITEGVVGSVEGTADAWNRLHNRPKTGVRAQRDAASLSAASAQGGGMVDAESIRQMERYEDALRRLSQAESLAFEQIARNTSAGPERNAQIRAMTQAIDALDKAYVDLQARGQAGILDAGQLASAESQWQAIVSGVRNGSMSTDEANAATQRLLSSLQRIPSVFDFMIPQASDFADELGRAAANAAAIKIPGMEGQYIPTARRDGTVPSTMPGAAMTPEAALDAIQRGREAEIDRINKERERQRQRENDARLEKEQADADRLAKAQRSAEMAGMDNAGQRGYLANYLSMLTEGTEEYLSTQADINRLDKQLRDEALRDQEKIQREWEQAAREVAQAFEQEIEKVMNLPGLTSVTPVTGEQMLDSRYGVYTEQIDEWRRRAGDELITHYRQIGPDGKEILAKREGGQDWADVDPAQIRAMLGLPGDLPGDIVARKLDEAWGSGRLFADPKNLGLIDEDALRAQYEQVKQGEQGRANLRQHVIDTLGLSSADAALVTGTQSPLAAMLSGGQSEAEMMAQIPDVGETLRQRTLKALEEGGGYIEAFRNGLKKDIDENIASLESEADRFANIFNGRIKTQIGKGVLDSAIANAVASAIESLADGL